MCGLTKSDAPIHWPILGLVLGFRNYFRGVFEHVMMQRNEKRAKTR
jgi:hypothetical protein